MKAPTPTPTPHYLYLCASARIQKAFSAEKYPLSYGYFQLMCDVERVIGHGVAPPIDPGVEMVRLMYLKADIKKTESALYAISAIARAKKS